MNSDKGESTGSNVSRGRPRPAILGLALVAVIITAGYYHMSVNGIDLPFTNDSKQTITRLVLPTKEKPVFAPEPVAEPIPVPKQVEDSSSPSGNNVPDKPVEVAKVIPPAEPVAEPKPKAAKPKWIDRQNPEHFTLQIMGSRKRDLIEKFIKKHKLGSEATIVASRHKGGDWYVLVYGSYPDRQQANQALSTIPERLRESGPWPRKIVNLRP